MLPCSPLRYFQRFLTIMTSSVRVKSVLDVKIGTLAAEIPLQLSWFLDIWYANTNNSVLQTIMLASEMCASQ